MSEDNRVGRNGLEVTLRAAVLKANRFAKL